MTAFSRPALGPGIFWGLSSFQILAMFRRGLFYAYLSVYLRYYLGLSVTATTLFATLPMLANIAAQNLIWGRLSDRYQRRRSFIIGGELLGAVGTVAVWYAHTLAVSPRVSAWIVIAGLTVVEFFWAMSNIGWSALITDLYPPESRGATQGRLTSIGALGRIAGVWIGGLLYDGLGRHFPGWGFAQGALFFVAAGVMLISTLPMAFMPEGGIASGEADAKRVADGVPSASFRRFTLFLIAMALINFGRNSVVVIQSQYLFLDTGFAVTSRTLAHIFNTESVAMIITGFLVGRVLDRTGNAWGILIGTAIGLTYLLTFATTERMILVYMASFLKGASEAMIVAAAYAAASVMIPPRQRARWFGLFNATFFLSWGLAGTLIAGPLVDAMIRFGQAPGLAYRFSYLAAFGLTLAGGVLLGLLFFGRQRPPTPATG
ncbi:MAG: MFS transporter [Desulfobacterales bacterium]|nr:MFS transporter [Desulfobacterales bacterium]